MQSSIMTLRCPVSWLQFTFGLVLFHCLVTVSFCQYPFTTFKIKTRILKFYPIVPEPRSTVFITSDASPVVNLDGAYIDTPLVDITDHPLKAPVMFRAHCYVQDLSPEYTITSFRWCFKLKMTDNDQCVDAQTSEFRASNGAPFIAKPNSQQGMLVWSLWTNIFQDMSATRPDLTGYYWCRLVNKLGSLDSPMFQVRDFMNQRIKLSFQYGFDTQTTKQSIITKTIEPIDLPYNFDCGKATATSRTDGLNAMEQAYNDLMSPYEWTVCGLQGSYTGTINAYSCQRDDKTDDLQSVKLTVPVLGETTLNMNGTLTLLKMRPTIKNVLLFCQFIGSPIPMMVYGSSFTDTYIGTVVKFNINGAKYTGGVVPLSPLQSQVKLRTGQFKNKRPRLSGLYKAQDSISFVWSHNVKGVLTEQMGYKVDQYHLTLPENVTIDLAGIYTLKVAEVTFTFDVSVAAPPVISNAQEIFRETFIMNGGSTGVTYEVASSPKDGDLKNELFINGYQLKLDDLRSLQESVSNLPREPTDKLRYLQVQVEPMGSAITSPTLNYSVRNLIFNSYDVSGQSHAVTFSSSNTAGEALITSVIKVLPTPEATEYPLTTSCTGSRCTATKDTAFKCIFPTEKYINEGVYVRKFWYFTSDPKAVTPLNDENNNNSITLTQPNLILLDGSVPSTLDGQTITLTPQGTNTTNNVTVSENILFTAADLSHYFSLEYQNDTLVLRPFRSKTRNFTSTMNSTAGGVQPGGLPTTTAAMDARMAQALKNASVVCRLLLIRPESLEKYGDNPSIEQLLDRQYLLFDSMEATGFTSSMMVATIQLWQGDVSTASLGWIAAVIIGLILLALLIILIVYFCTREKKETYKVDAEERDHGNDPLKEIKEKEEFHTYERGDDANDRINSPNGLTMPVRGPIDPMRHDLEGSVGVNSSDEHELDEYALDTKNFNEDGSFLNEYRPNPRSSQVPPSASSPLRPSSQSPEYSTVGDNTEV